MKDFLMYFSFFISILLPTLGFGALLTYLLEIGQCGLAMASVVVVFSAIFAAAFAFKNKTMGIIDD